MHALLVGRHDAIAGCLEGVDEEAEAQYLAHFGDLPHTLRIALSVKSVLAVVEQNRGVLRGDQKASKRQNVKSASPGRGLRSQALIRGQGHRSGLVLLVLRCISWSNGSFSSNSNPSSRHRSATVHPWCQHFAKPNQPGHRTVHRPE
jgi:hypothetical protein